MPGVTVDEAIRYTDPARAEVDMVFQFDHIGVDHGPGGRFDVRPLLLRDLKASLGRWQAGLQHTGWNSLYWCNHDQPRVVSRFGDDGVHRRRSAKMLATVLHLHRGTPFVYQGEELGMTNFAFSDESQLRDIETLNFVANAKELGRSSAEIMAAVNAGARDHARTPMQWNATPHAGFTTGEPWMAVNPNSTSLNVAAEADDPHSVFHHYRRLIELRHELAVIAEGDFTMLLADDERIYAFSRRLDDVEVLVLANFTGDDAGFELPDAERWRGAELLLTNLDPPDDSRGIDVALEPWEARVYQRSVR
jgi:oligo-1,6-glucosidase